LPLLGASISEYGSNRRKTYATYPTFTETIVIKTDILTFSNSERGPKWVQPAHFGWPKSGLNGAESTVC
jgi:hypothetical protein